MCIVVAIFHLEPNIFQVISTTRISLSIRWLEDTPFPRFLFLFHIFVLCKEIQDAFTCNVAVYQIGEVRSSDGRAGRVVSRWRIPLLRRIFLKELEKRKESTNLFIRFFFPFFFFLLLEKIIYPRNTRTLTKTSVVGGKPIDEKTCMVIR